MVYDSMLDIFWGENWSLKRPVRWWRFGGWEFCAGEVSAQKNAVPLLVGPGLRGGRWPEAHVERDGERCYCGRGWVLRAPNSTATTANLGGTIVAIRVF